MGESRSLLPTSSPAAPASSLSSGSLPLDLVSPRRRGSGGCGEARIGDPAFDPAPVGAGAILESLPSLPRPIGNRASDFDQIFDKNIKFPTRLPLIRRDTSYYEPAYIKKP